MKNFVNVLKVRFMTGNNSLYFILSRHDNTKKDYAALLMLSKIIIKTNTVTQQRTELAWLLKAVDTYV